MTTFFFSLFHFFRSHGLWLLCLPLLLLSACSDDDDLALPSAQPVSLSETTVRLTPKAQFHTLRALSATPDEQLTVTTDCDWIILTDSVTGTDGYFEFCVSALTDGVPRTGRIVFSSSAKPAVEAAVCEVVQGEADGMNSELPANQTMRVGYGYNIYGLYQSDVNTTAPIIDYNRLLKLNEEINLMQTEQRSLLDINHTVARNRVELAELLTKEQETTSSSITGATKTCKSGSSSSSFQHNEELYVQLSLNKTCQWRNLDVGCLLWQIDKDPSLLFTDDFLKLRNEIIANPGNKDKIDKLLQTYGTHMVVQSELGASIQVSIAFNQQMSGELEMRAADFEDFFFRNKSSDFLIDTKYVKDVVTDFVNKDNSCVISGGTPQTQEQLRNSIREQGRLLPEVLEAWLSSTSLDPTTPQGEEGLAPINFRCIPIWILFPSSVAGNIITAAKAMGSQSNNSVDDLTAGTAFYEINLTNELLSFGNGPADTQVRTLYVDAGGQGLTPILEICNEYVPTLRGDRRVPVVYGLRDGSPFIGAGFFPGDGEGNPPAWLTFSDGQVYVRPIEGCDADSVMRRIFFINGRIYEKNFNTQCYAPKSPRSVDQYLQFTKQYPIVKIGSGYWTRTPICERMYFGDYYSPGDPNSAFQLQEKIGANGYLFASVYGRNKNSFLNKYVKVYGDDEHSVYGKRTKWYLPKNADLSELMDYVGNNPRMLMKNQASGFEATFIGVYGPWDDVVKDLFGEEVVKYRYVDEYCFIPGKNENNAGNGMVLALHKDYTLNLLSTQSVYLNYYPIRLFRTAYWKYLEIER